MKEIILKLTLSDKILPINLEEDQWDRWKKWYQENIELFTSNEISFDFESIDSSKELTLDHLNYFIQWKKSNESLTTKQIKQLLYFSP